MRTVILLSVVLEAGFTALGDVLHQLNIHLMSLAVTHIVGIIILIIIIIN